MIKSLARTLIQQWLDDPSSKRWSNTNLDYVTQFAIDQLWGDILDISVYYKSQYQSIASLHNSQYVDLKTVADGGDLNQRIYKIQSVAVAGRSYSPKDPRDYLLTAGETGVLVATPFTYQILENRLYPFSSDTTFGPTPVDLRYSYLPAAYTGLADGVAVDFPDGNEAAFILLSASLAMAKGNVEEVSQLMSLANLAKKNLLDGVQRRYVGPTVPYSTQSSNEFGGT